jgi:hypothetical protein
MVQLMLDVRYRKYSLIFSQNVKEIDNDEFCLSHKVILSNSFDYGHAETALRNNYVSGDYTLWGVAFPPWFAKPEGTRSNTYTYANAA